MAALLVPATPQPQDYHDFADHRALLGVANALDVLSNAGFLLAGLAGLWLVLRPRLPLRLRLRLQKALTLEEAA